MKSRFLRLDRSQKIIVILALLLIFSSPFIITHRFDGSSTNSPIKETVTPTETEPEVTADDFWREKWEQEQSVQFLESSDIAVVSNTNTFDDIILETFIRNEFIISVSKTTVFLSGNNTNTSATIPDEKIVQSASYMNDLGLLFLLTEDNIVFSWSPTTNIFSTNTFPLPETATQPKIIGTFLTYLYVFDSGSGDLFRFPRETGGFGEPVSWLRESFSFDNPTHWSISESLYVADGNTVMAFFQGRKSNFSLGSFFVPLHITDILAINDALIILDSDNGRIVISNPETGVIEKNIVSEAFLSSTHLSGANTQTIYIRSETGEILSISR